MLRSLGCFVGRALQEWSSPPIVESPMEPSVAVVLSNHKQLKIRVRESSVVISMDGPPSAALRPVTRARVRVCRESIPTAAKQLARPRAVEGSSELSRVVAGLDCRYEIERVLREGALACVYVAHDTRLDRRVAIKFLRPDVVGTIHNERFLAEIKTTARLHHPHILSLIDSGDAGGVPYYVMPFIEGKSVCDRLRAEKQLPVQDALRIATQVASALEFAHRHGVIHRDIKPANILLHEGEALVADLGIALSSFSADDSRLTSEGCSLGTPRYMSPEQALGERTIDGRTDIYSLGCVLYEMLTGEPPFVGANFQCIVGRLITDRPPGVRLVRESVTPSVEWAILKALEKLPADRFATASDFSSALVMPQAA